MRNAFVNTLIDCARQDPAVALLMAEVGFSVVEPIKRIVPRSMAGRMESDCAFDQRWHSSSSRYVGRP